jgi:hypothetical protein
MTWPRAKTCDGFPQIDVFMIMDSFFGWGQETPVPEKDITASCLDLAEKCPKYA